MKKRYVENSLMQEAFMEEREAALTRKRKPLVPKSAEVNV